MRVLNWLKENKLLTAILLIGATLRLYHINYQSVWLDEIHTINEASPDKSFSGVYDSLMASEALPPLYFWLVNIIFKIFGYTALVVRLFSAMIGILGIFSVYVLGRELYSKKVGLIAAALLAINYFHIYYSQEARLYSMLFLFTTVSFIYLIRFIKKPTYKTAVFYGITAALMIYSHFFAVFTLLAQCLILLYYIVYPYAVTRKQFFIFSLVSGLVAIVLYLPTYKLIIKTTEIQKMWIEMPSLDVFTQFFKDFFGQSEIVVFFVVLLLLLFFFRLFNVEKKETNVIDPTEDKMVFTSLLLFSWIFVTLLLPLIKTYTSIPMLINRYFINILPALIILIAVGSSFVKNKTIRYGILSLIAIFSLTDIIIVKKYYTQVNKTQFREVSQFIIDNNKNNDPVNTSIPWYFPFFLNNDKVKMTIQDNTLDNIAAQMVNDPTQIKSFWFVDGHIKPYKVSEETQKFLDDKFFIEDNIELYDCWTRHYVIGGDKLQILDISKFKDLQPFNGDNFMSNIEKFEVTDNKVNVIGFAFFENQSAATSKYDIVLIKDHIAYKLKTTKVARPDVTSYFKSSADVSNSGFNSTLNLDKLAPGKYKLAMHLINAETNKEGLIITDKIVERP